MVFGVHALAYVLIKFLPDTAISALGILSAQKTALEGFKSSTEIGPYQDVLYRLLNFDLGVTLDRVPVLYALLNAFIHSFGKMLVAFLFIILSVIITCLYDFGYTKKRILEKSIFFGIFVPSFFLPLLFFSVLMVFNILPFNASGNVIYWIVATFAIMLSPMFIVIMQSKKIMMQLLSKQFAIRYLALGFSVFERRMKLMINLFDELMPTLEKLLTAMLTQVILTESIFGLEGIGSLAVRAVRRSDPNLILGVVLIFAIIVACSRIFTVALRANNRGWR